MSTEMIFINGTSVEPDSTENCRKSPEASKKRKKHVWTSISIIAAVLAIVIVLQWERVQLIYYVMTVDAENAQTQAAKSKEVMENYISLPDIMVSLSEVDKASITSGEISAAEAATEILASTSALEILAPTARPATGYEYEIKLRLTELYVLQDMLTASLNQVILAVHDEYMALPENERSPSVKISICLFTLSEFFALEDSCDKQVDLILNELSQLLTESGGDLSLAEQARNNYENQKAAIIATLVS